MHKTMREARRAMGLTQAVLAERLGISQVFLSAIEAGRHHPRLETLARIEKILGQPVRWYDAPTPLEIVEMIVRILRAGSQDYPIDTLMEYLVRLIRNNDITPERTMQILRVMAGIQSPDNNEEAAQ